MHYNYYLLGRNKSPWFGAKVTVSFPDSTLLDDVDGRWTYKRKILIYVSIAKAERKKFRLYYLFNLLKHCFRIRTCSRCPIRGSSKLWPGNGKLHVSISWQATSKLTSPFSKNFLAMAAVACPNKFINGSFVNKMTDFW